MLDHELFKASSVSAQVRQYIQTQVPQSDRAAVEKLLLAEGKGFLHALAEFEGDYAEALMEFISSYGRGKTEAMLRLREFLSWLSPRLNLDLQIEWPQVDLDERFERIIAIARLLQGQPPMSEQEAVDYIHEHIWVSDRTIREDFKVMREGMPGGINSALAQTFQIESLSANRRPIEFLSSAHPIFLMENLSGIICMLEGLLERAQDQLHTSFCMDTANHIWSQLTDYARERVSLMIHKDYPDSSPVLQSYNQLLSMPHSTAFRSEQNQLLDIPDTLWYFAKCASRCWIEWVDERGVKHMDSGIPMPPNSEEEWAQRIFHLRMVNEEKLSVPLSAIISISPVLET